jgi:hypothetical protein
MSRAKLRGVLWGGCAPIATMVLSAGDKRETNLLPTVAALAASLLSTTAFSAEFTKKPSGPGQFSISLNGEIAGDKFETLVAGDVHDTVYLDSPGGSFQRLRE